MPTIKVLLHAYATYQRCCSFSFSIVGIVFGLYTMIWMLYAGSKSGQRGKCEKVIIGIGDENMQKDLEI